MSIILLIHDEPMDPIDLFNRYYKDVQDVCPGYDTSACCLSTIGTDGFPNARFVSLKGVISGRFVITGPLRSQKCRELALHPAAAITFWWPDANLQIRIQGETAFLSRDITESLFRNRPVSAQIASSISNQGEFIGDPDELVKMAEAFEIRYHGKEIPCPVSWGGFSLDPVRMEFLEFRMSRLHKRLSFQKSGETWSRQWLQP
jgi:pyridoxamine 5'-phosphate oxidase